MADNLLEVPSEVNEALALVRENRVRLESLMTADVKFSAKHSDAAAKLAQAVKALSTEARLWAGQLQERASKATPEQRSAAAIQHLSGLPQGPRAAAYRELIRAEGHNVQRLPLEMKL